MPGPTKAKKRRKNHKPKEKETWQSAAKTHASEAAS
jgi:hypothetical protein